MEENLRSILIDKKENIGGLCLYLKRRGKLIDELNNNFNDELNKILTTSQKIWCYLNNKDIFCGCGKLKKWKDFKTGWRETCGDILCIVEKRKKTNLLIYGVDNPTKNRKIRDKINLTNLEKYGFESASKNTSVKNKISKSLNNRSDIEKNKSKLKRIENWKNRKEEEKENILNKRNYTNEKKTIYEKNSIVKKRKETCLKKYKSEYAISSKEIRNKIEKIFNEKFNGNSPFSSPDVKNKSIETYKNSHIKKIKDQLKKLEIEYVNHTIDERGNINYVLKCERSNKNFNISYTNLRVRLLSNLEISPFFRKEFGKSTMENNIFQFIKNNYDGKIIRNTKDLIFPMELDIYLPELNLSFEFNGLYWHSEIYKSNDYHLIKTEECEKLGIRLIHIYEDDWIYKKEIVKSRILNLLGKSERLFARKCEIGELYDNKTIREFLEKNHIQGFVGSKIKIGLFYNEELVSLMTFGNLRRHMGQKEKMEIFELLRFCNKLNTNVIGGASRMFKYFIEKYNPSEIISYADRSWSTGNLYKTLGFEFVHKTPPNYFYIIDGIRKCRFNFRKDKLIKQGLDSNKTEHEIMLESGLFRIYDSGSLKFTKISI